MAPTGMRGPTGSTTGVPPIFQAIIDAGGQNAFMDAVNSQRQQAGMLPINPILADVKPPVAPGGGDVPMGPNPTVQPAIPPQTPVAPTVPQQPMPENIPMTGLAGAESAFDEGLKRALGNLNRFTFPLRNLTVHMMLSVERIGTHDAPMGTKSA